MDEQKRLEQISLEELIEKERANLPADKQTKVTLETFIAWKKGKLREKQEKEAQEAIKKQTNAKAGRNVSGTNNLDESHCLNLRKDLPDEICSPTTTNMSRKNRKRKAWLLSVKKRKRIQ